MFSYFIIGKSLYQSELEAEEYKKTLDTTTTDLFFRSNKLNDLNIRLDNELQLSESNKLSFGMALNSNNIKTTLSKELAFKNDSTDRSQIKSIYVQDELTLLKNLVANIGYRGSYYDRTNNYFHEPRMDLIYSPTNYFSLSRLWSAQSNDQEVE